MTRKPKPDATRWTIGLDRKGACVEVVVEIRPVEYRERWAWVARVTGPTGRASDGPPCPSEWLAVADAAPRARNAYGATRILSAVVTP